MTHDDRRRLLLTAAIFLVLAAVALIVPFLVTPVTLLLLTPAPIVNWQAFLRLRRNFLLRDGVGPGELILSLGLAVDRAWYLAVSSTVLALLCLFVIARSEGLLSSVGPTVFAILLIYPLVLSAYPPALETLRTINRLEQSPADE